jgi:hypothetical protein
MAKRTFCFYLVSLQDFSVPLYSFQEFIATCPVNEALMYRTLVYTTLLLGVAASPEGPDVSSYQGVINWGQVKAHGAGFAMAKATEGITYKDKYFAANWAGMEASGK